MGGFAHENRFDCSKNKYHLEKISAIFVFVLFMDNISSTSSVCTPQGTLLLAKPSITNELSTPGYPGSYPVDSTCVWNISAPLGHIVKLTFSDFVLQFNYLTTCSQGDHVELWDGTFSSDDLIKRYCFTVGNREPGSEPHFSSGQHMYVKFKTDDTNSKPRGFKALYTAVKLVTSCSSRNTDEQNNNIVLTNTSGNFSSPRFPSSYPSIISCTWIIKLPSTGNIVSLAFPSFELDKSLNANCRGDYADSVEVFNGVARTDDSLGRYCFQTPPPTKIFSTGRKLTVAFQSKKSTWSKKKGFLSSFTSLNQTGILGACVKANKRNDIQILNHEGGVITSPNYPQHYPNDMECIWTLIAPVGKRIKFVFMGKFEMEQERDYVEIRDGLTNTSFSLGRFSQTKPTQPVYTSGPQALVRFKTDDLFRYKGFYLMYEAVKQACFPSLASLTASPSIKKEFTSPFFPSPYPEGFNCEWNITAPEGYFVKLRFVKFSLQYNGGVRKFCAAGDYVELRDGPSSSEVIKRYCSSGTSSDRPISGSIFSTGRSIYVKFKSDLKGPNKKGFRIRYTAIKQVTSCSPSNSEDQNRNIVFNSPSGTIRSSNFPSSGCTWNIKTPRVNSIVNLSFPIFDVGRTSTSYCSWMDYIEIFDGFEVEDVSLGQFCSVERPPTIFTTGQKLTIVLNRGIHPSGEFLATYSSISQTGISGKCDAPYSSHKIQVTNSGGAIVSPRFPLNYPNNMKCTWSITVPSDKRIKLQFLGSFGVVERGCLGFRPTDDYVSIKDGFSAQSKSLGKFCRGKPDSPVLTSGRHALVEFRSDERGTYKGFYLIYEAVRKASPGSKIEGYCSPYKTSRQSFELHKSSGSIASPDYPRIYPPNINCRWIITVPHGKRVKLTVNDLDITYYYTSCNSGHVEVKDGQYTRSPSLGRFCGKTRPDILFSSDRYMSVEFTSYGALKTRGKGFSASFTAVDGESSVASQDTAHGSVVGIIIGIIVAVVFVALLLCCCRKRQRAASYRSVPNASANPMTTLHSRSHPPVANSRGDASASPSYPQPSAPQMPDPVTVPQLPDPATTHGHLGDNSPPKYDDLPPPPPYPGLAADSSQPQYPLPGEQYPWQPDNQRSKSTAPQC